MSKKMSMPKSFEGWEVLKWIKGQKKVIIGLIGTGLGYILSNNETIALISGAVFAAGVSVLEYYLKKVDNR